MNPKSNGRNGDPFVVVNESHTMTCLYLEPIKTPNVESNVVTHVKDFVSSNVVGSVGTSVRCTSQTVNLV